MHVTNECVILFLASAKTGSTGIQRLRKKGSKNTGYRFKSKSVVIFYGET